MPKFGVTGWSCDFISGFAAKPSAADFRSPLLRIDEKSQKGWRLYESNL